MIDYIYSWYAYLFKNKPVLELSNLKIKRMQQLAESTGVSYEELSDTFKKMKL